MTLAARPPPSEPAPRYLLVDGHSVVHSWSDLRQLHSRKPASAREELIRQLSRLHDSGKWNVTLVFDGQRGGKQERPHDSMAVLFASAGQTADSIIERIVQIHSGRGEIGVVTADHAEMTAVESLGAFGFSPAWLQNELRVAELEIKDFIGRTKKEAHMNSHSCQ